MVRLVPPCDDKSTATSAAWLTSQGGGYDHGVKPHDVFADGVMVLENAAGLRVEMLSNGSVRRMFCGDIMVNLFTGSEAEGALANVWLGIGESEYLPLTGPMSGSRLALGTKGCVWSGQHEQVRYRVEFNLSQDAPTWFWRVWLENLGDETLPCTLLHTQDIGISHEGAVRLNEYFVSQYIDHNVLDHPDHGPVIASRQNQPMGGNHPFTMIGALDRATSYATDAMQVYALYGRTDAIRSVILTELPGERLQHEHSMVGLEAEEIRLEPSATGEAGFFGHFIAHHPEASGSHDLARIEEILRAPLPPVAVHSEPVEVSPSLFSAMIPFVSEELGYDELQDLFPGEWRHAETDADGDLYSFFTGEAEHVVLPLKDRMVLRPHGQIVRTGRSLTPDEAAMTTTMWMSGVFHSMVTQGHVSINRFLSTCHSYIGLFHAHGLRIFIEREEHMEILAQPSLFVMRPDGASWIYQNDLGRIIVDAGVGETVNSLSLRLRTEGMAPSRFLVSMHCAVNGDDGNIRGPVEFSVSGDEIRVKPKPGSELGSRFPDGAFVVRALGETGIEEVGGDEWLYQDMHSRDEPFLCLVMAEGIGFELSMEGHLVEAGSEGGTAPALLRWKADTDDGLVCRLQEITPWFVQNALVHYLAPRGLEQYSGGGWGTRDVCQGAFELLLAMGRFAEARDLLLRVFRQQNPDGDWPQWFMFFERERGIRPGDSHGDIVYWPVLAVARYLRTTRDISLLEETLPYFAHDPAAAGEPVSLLSHIDQALALMEARVVPGTDLAAYGHGDWNDALQPARPEMRENLCSSWTVTLNHETVRELAEAFHEIGLDDRADKLIERAERILTAFQHTLLPDGVLAGMAYFQKGTPRSMLHPRDEETGIHYSALAMIHAILSDMFTPEQAAEHLALIEEHLTGPDGVRLFDKPLAYRGGVMSNFQRAETASYFGREIGIMYTHAHLRFAEALAHIGDADGFLQALCKTCPIGLQELVPSAAPRQANCYYSSSDGAFSDRYEASEHYVSLLDGDVALEGGWRVYSSGAGIGVRLIVQRLLGVTVCQDHWIFDPVIPSSLDGLEVTLSFGKSVMTIRYRIGPAGCGVSAVKFNDAELPMDRMTNPYRLGAVRVSMPSDASGVLEITVG
jgi:cellobiose phosphorylase